MRLSAPCFKSTSVQRGNWRIGRSEPQSGHITDLYTRIVRQARERVFASPLVTIARGRGQSDIVQLTADIRLFGINQSSQISIHPCIAAFHDPVLRSVGVIPLRENDIPAPEHLGVRNALVRIGFDLIIAELLVDRHDHHIAVDESFGRIEINIAIFLEFHAAEHHGRRLYPWQIARLQTTVPQYEGCFRLDPEVLLRVGEAAAGQRLAVALHVGTEAVECIGRIGIIGIGRALGTQINDGKRILGVERSLSFDDHRFACGNTSVGRSLHGGEDVLFAIDESDGFECFTGMSGCYDQMQHQCLGVGRIA